MTIRRLVFWMNCICIVLLLLRQLNEIIHGVMVDKSVAKSLPQTTTETTKSKEEVLQEAASKTPLPLPLEPPYRLIQLGHPRTGSTFQFYLIDAIAQLKTAEQQQQQQRHQGAVLEQQPTNRSIGTSINFAFKPTLNGNIERFGESFVIKSHSGDPEKLKEWQNQKKIILFTSGIQPHETLFHVTMYNQNIDDLNRCPLCQVDHYQRLFGLTEQQVDIIKEYMENFSLIRQCCGLQMSKYEMARLHGCHNLTAMSQLPQYPHCEQMDKAAVEKALMQSPIAYRVSYPQFNWAKPGDCTRFDEMIASGYGFNGKRYNPQEDCPI